MISTKIDTQRVRGALRETLQPVIRDVVENRGKALLKSVSKYPPLSEANRPGRIPYWYERGYGIKYPSGKGRRTSEHLHKKWTLKTSKVSVRLSNSASYAKYVHDKNFQPDFHKRRGWKTYQDEAERILNELPQRFNKRVKEWVKKYGLRYTE